MTEESVEITSPIVKSDYKLTIGLNTLNHLGLNLYSNVPSVISEVVANSWDADAEKVEIDIDSDSNIITITDDGCGMTKDECNRKYLEVGYPRREKESAITPKSRHVMGRKGIGKLSLFSIAKTIEVHTVKINDKGDLEKSGFIMDVDIIKDYIQNEKGVKGCPLPAIKEENIEIEKGTKLIISNLKKNLKVTEKYLRRRIARRFSIMGDKNHFNVIINGIPVTVEDREYYNKIQYLWYMGDYGKECMEQCKNLEEKEEMDGIVDKENGYSITGWIGTFDERKSIEKGNNTIIVQAWGKTIHEDILKDIEEGGLFTKYLIGEIRADFLDLDDKDDIATSDRQRLKEDDPRFLKLKDYIENTILKTIYSKWADWRTKSATEKALENEKVKEWFDSLKGDLKKYAQKLFMKIESFPIEDLEYKKGLYRHGIIAFETLALRESLSTLDSIDTEKEFELLTSLFDGMDQLEALHYHEIVKTRVGVLEKFENIVPSSKEKIIQEHVFDHLWLLDSSWERADSATAHLEESVIKEFEKVTANLTEEEKKARIDIRYKTAAGKHIIIELKKYDAKVNVHDLAKQIGKYKHALSKCLKEKLPERVHAIEIVCILGSPPTGGNEEEITKTLDAYNARYTTYDTLIESTRRGYKDYLNKQKEINRIQEIIDAL